MSAEFNRLSIDIVISRVSTKVVENKCIPSKPTEQRQWENQKGFQKKARKGKESKQNKTTEVSGTHKVIGLYTSEHITFMLTVRDSS